jgi:hypothetical protein
LSATAECASAEEVPRSACGSSRESRQSRIAWSDSENT